MTGKVCDSFFLFRNVSLLKPFSLTFGEKTRAGGGTCLNYAAYDGCLDAVVTLCQLGGKKLWLKEMSNGLSFPYMYWKIQRVD